MATPFHSEMRFFNALLKIVGAEFETGAAEVFVTRCTRNKFHGPVMTYLATSLISAEAEMIVRLRNAYAAGDRPECEKLIDTLYEIFDRLEDCERKSLHLSFYEGLPQT